MLKTFKTTNSHFHHQIYGKEKPYCQWTGFPFYAKYHIIYTLRHVLQACLNIMEAKQLEEYTVLTFCMCDLCNIYNFSFSFEVGEGWLGIRVSVKVYRLWWHKWWILVRYLVLHPEWLSYIRIVRYSLSAQRHISLSLRYIHFSYTES